MVNWISGQNKPKQRFDFQLPRQLGGSMPNCASSAGSSRHSSRGSIYSNCYGPVGGGGGSGPSSRRSSGSRPGSRRESLFNNDMGLVMEDQMSVVGQGTSAPPGSPAQGNFLQTLGSGVVGAASSIYQSSITPPRYRKTLATRHHNLPFN